MNSVLDSDTLRQVQLTQLEMLIEFDRICKENNLPYQLFAGTLLGAIRHKGFIPWDDDIDVVMARSDYDKFLSIYKNESESKYFLQNYETDPNFFRQFSRLRKNNTIYLQSGYKDIDMHHGIFIDIFPLDNVKIDSIGESFRYKILYMMARINTIRNRGVSRKSNIIKRLFGKLIEFSNAFIEKSTYDKLETRIMKMFNNENTGYLNHLTNGTTKGRFYKYLMEVDNYHNMIKWEFEGYNFPIPKNYHDTLTNLYGDYMKLPSKELRKPHHGIIEVKLD